MVLSLGRPTVVSTAHALGAVAPLLLAIACSAPPGTGDDADTVAPFGSGPTASANGLQPTTNGAGGSGVATSGTGGTTGTEAPAGNVGLSPTPPTGGAQNTNMGQQMGAGGAPSMGAAGASGGSAGANSGSAGTSGALPMGGAGSTAMPPAPTNPTPTNPPPANPPPAANGNCPGQFLCENFEGVAAGAFNTGTWQVIDRYSPVAQNAAVQVSTAQAHTGVQSLHVNASDTRNGIVATLPQNKYFLRAWLRVEAVPVGPVFIGLGTDQNSETRLRIQGQSFAVINTVGPNDAVRPDEANSGNCPGCVTLTPNRWFCAEFSIDNAARESTMWIDGVEAARIVSGQDWPIQPASPKLFLGSMGVQGGQAGVFIDDVAVGSTRINCD